MNYACKLRLHAYYGLGHMVKYRNALDGLRAICIIFTIFNHISFVPSYIDGSFGVDIFFALSGWLITWLLLRDSSQDQKINLKSFYIRRFFRIVPLYAFTIFIYFCASELLARIGQPEKQNEFFTALPYIASFNSEFRPVEAGNSFLHAWTLGIEEKFYIIWPCILFFLLKKPLWAFTVSALIIGGLLFASNGESFFVRGYFGLAFGALLAIIVKNKPRLIDIFKKSEIASICVGLMVLTYIASLIFPMVNIWNLAMSFCGAGLVASLWFNEDSPTSRILSFSPLAWAGKLTFAIYLTHVLVLNAVEIGIDKLGLENSMMLEFTLAYPLSIAFAYILHITIEKPCITMGRKIASGPIFQAGFSPRI